jgi:hypothetical protein
MVIGRIPARGPTDRPTAGAARSLAEADPSGKPGGARPDRIFHKMDYHI